ncbi:ZIP family metal transporter [Tepidiphilus baoligensis]|uniref:ZIP family metal transporter n=1 Tax=Tepidiphilus baoligensis TaxID=2698687 RepID=A0ABX1QNZ0_9PROT|nr:hypothetical protein [Tepidiphilus baoligensis]MDD3433934.1 hypothetical protein [Tepidiphilus sp.]NMH17427.1 hypothetical protein [Tepidiphilus baoligensis]
MISKVLARFGPMGTAHEPTQRKGGALRAFRAALGWAIWLAGAAVLFAAVLVPLKTASPWGFLVCLSLSAALGGLLIARTLSSWVLASPVTAEIFAAGVMGTSVIVGLILPSIQEIASQDGGQVQTMLRWMLMLGLGAGMLALLDRLVPHRHEPLAGQERSARLFLFALALHNVPEGLALSMSEVLGPSLALGIAIQNVPESVLAMWLLTAAGWSDRKAGVWAFAAVSVEPVVALLTKSLGLVGTEQALSMAGLAAGAMGFVLIHEFAPRLRQSGMRAILPLVGGAALVLGLSYWV